MACHIRKDDEVEVIAGDHKGQKGKVLKVDIRRGLVLVQGINMVFRHVRPSRRNPQGGRIQKEMPIHISNVLPVDPKSNVRTRVAFRVEKDGSKVRLAVKSGEVLGTVRKGKGE